ncbi:MAG: hypothetical protein Q7R39_20760 [Dehalococcoidia bacterium]|nr:hypothetical protein [Dehalococcoidia bacterium]
MSTRTAFREKTRDREVMQERMSNPVRGAKEAPGKDGLTASEGLRSGHGETPSALPIEVRLVVNGEEGYGLGCDNSGLPTERRSSLAGRDRIGGVGSLSRHLMAVERARALGKTPLGFRTWALERESKSGWRQRLKSSANARDEPGRC